MSADNSHAERKSAKRYEEVITAVADSWIPAYDRRLEWQSEFDARSAVIAEMSTRTEWDSIYCAEILADALARRASLKHKGD